jgi:hypothetical protein
MKPDNPLHKTKEWTSIREFFSEWGKKGGAARSDVKTAAVRANARKPRPNARGPRKPKGGQ